MKPAVIQLNPFPTSEGVQKRLQNTTQLKMLPVKDLMENPDQYQSVEGLLSLLSDTVSAEIMAVLPSLKVIANYGAGFNNIDIEAATARGIQVTNTPGALSETVADFTFGLMLAVCRRIVESDEVMRRGEFTGWAPDYQLGMDLYGKTLGIVGLGDIGRCLIQRAHGFSMRVLYHNRKRFEPELEERLGIHYAGFDDLLAQSDFVSVHTPYSPETHHLFNATAFAKMKPGSIFINTARGAVMDEAALVSALQSGHLWGAGLDVYEHEPKVNPALVAMKNVVLTAHIGSATEATRKRMGDLAIENLLAVLAGQTPLTPVNQLTLSR